MSAPRGIAAIEVQLAQEHPGINGAGVLLNEILELDDGSAAGAALPQGPRTLDGTLRLLCGCGAAGVPQMRQTALETHNA